MMKKFPHKNSSRLSDGAQLAEFGASIYLLFILVVTPFVIGFIVTADAIISYVATSEAAKSAAAQTNYFTALEAARQKVTNILELPLCKLVIPQRTDPNDLQLFIEVTNIDSGQTSEVGPNKPLAGKVDTEHNIYAIECLTHCKLGPLWTGKDKHDISTLGIPILNKSAEFVLRVRHNAECIDCVKAEGTFEDKQL